MKNPKKPKKFFRKDNKTGEEHVVYASEIVWISKEEFEATVSKVKLWKSTYNFINRIKGRLQ